MTNQCTEDRFLKDVAQHTMTVIRDDGVHRHLRFRKPRPAGSEYWFELITWPDVLCIDGDMGTYVFSRLNDMFEFFRADRGYAERKGQKLGINLGYWSEKLKAPEPREATEYSADRFRQHVKDAFDQWCESAAPDDDAPDDEKSAFESSKADLWHELQEDVLSVADDGDIRAYDSARGFIRGEFDMSDVWDWNCREYTFYFVWCCYAIAWGIKTYDDAAIAKAEGRTE